MKRRAFIINDNGRLLGRVRMVVDEVMANEIDDFNLKGISHGYLRFRSRAF